MAEIADIVIVGGGVHGASAAWHLARAGAGRIVLIEKADVAAGPTGKSGAMVRPIFTEAPYIQLVCESIAMFERWPDIVGEDAGWVGRGFLRITPDLQESNVGGDLDLMRELGVVYEIISADQLTDFVPFARFSESECGLWIKRAGYADPIKTTTSLVRSAQRTNVELKTGVTVTGFHTSSGRIDAVETDQGTIHTHTVLNCAGPWAPRLAEMLGITLPIETHRTPTCLFARPQTINLGGPILSDGVRRVYLRDVGDSLVRAAHFGWAPDAADPDNYDETIGSMELRRLRTAIASRFRCYEHSIFAGGFSAIYDMTPDAHPIIGRVGEIDGFWCNCGWSGNGFASAPAVGRHLAAQMLNGHCDVDLSMFTWPRPSIVRPRPDSAWIYR